MCVFLDYSITIGPSARPQSQIALVCAHTHGGNACADGGVLRGNRYGVGDDPHEGDPEGTKCGRVLIMA